MATIDLPTSSAFAGAMFSLSVNVSASAYTGFFTGVTTKVSHLADRLRATLTLPPCRAADAAQREALFLALLSTGDLLRMPMPHRLQRRGTLAGSPTVNGNHAAGVRTLSVSATSSQTLLAGDWISVGGNLLQCGYAGAVSIASVMSVPLVLPTQRAITTGAAVAYVAPTGLWQLDTDGLQIDYSAPVVQGGIALPLLQVIL